MAHSSPRSSCKEPHPEEDRLCEQMLVRKTGLCRPCREDRCGACVEKADTEFGSTGPCCHFLEGESSDNPALSEDPKDYRDTGYGSLTADEQARLAKVLNKDRLGNQAGCVWCGATGYGKECPPCEVKHEGESFPFKAERGP